MNRTRLLPVTDRLPFWLIGTILSLVVVIAAGVCVFLLGSSHHEMRFVTLVIGVPMCGVFWLAQRLLTSITILDGELMRLAQGAAYADPAAWET